MFRNTQLDTDRGSERFTNAAPQNCKKLTSLTRRGRLEDGDVVGGAGEDGAVVVDVVDVHGHREVRHALLQQNICQITA